MSKTFQHPLFYRIEQRDNFLRVGKPEDLILDANKDQNSELFIGLFQKSPEQELIDFTKNPDLPKVFVQLLGQRSKAEDLNLLCAFIDRLLDEDFSSVIKCFIPYSSDLSKACTSILINNEKDFEQRRFLMRTILLLLGSISSENNVDVSEDSINTFVRITLKILSLKLNDANYCFEGLKRSLRSEQIRHKFLDSDVTKLLSVLIAQAQKSNNSDAQYHILFCFWALTFSSEGLSLLSHNTFVDLLSRILNNTQPEHEELVRILTLIIQRLNQAISFIEAAYDADLLKLLRSLQAKKYVDLDLSKLIASVADNLNQNLKHLSLWDKYVREVKSGKLRNTLSHHSELFWKANVERFGENNFSILIALRELLESDDEETAIVACHDLGEYVSRHPLGRIKLEEIHAKEKIMFLLGTSKSPAIQQQALRTTQLLLLHND